MRNILFFTRHGFSSLSKGFSHTSHLSFTFHILPLHSFDVLVHICIAYKSLTLKFTVILLGQLLCTLKNLTCMYNNYHQIYRYIERYTLNRSYYDILCALKFCVKLLLDLPSVY